MPTNITITNTGDDSRGIDANGNVTISDDGTVVNITTSGAASKGFKVGNSENIGTFTLNGGTVTANISGTMVLEGTDPSYCSAVKTGHYVGNGGTLNVTATTGNASRAISADESILITNGDYTIINSCNGQAGTSDNYTAKALTCDKNITIEGGTFDIKMTGTGGKGLKADGELIIGKADGTGPTMKISTTGSSLSSGSIGRYHWWRWSSWWRRLASWWRRLASWRWWSWRLCKFRFFIKGYKGSGRSLH